MAAAGLTGLRMSGVGLCLEKPPTGTRSASAGWYRTGALAELARRTGADFEFHNADCFATGTKEAVLDRFAERFGPIDHLVYSVAAPRRIDPDGVTHQSVIKPIGAPHTTYSLDFDDERPSIRRIEVPPATDAETLATIKVMGGEDWSDWVTAAEARGLLAPGCSTVALSYVGSALTAPIYRDGTIGAAKAHLEETARRLSDSVLAGPGGTALTSVNGAAVTEASSAIPGISLYVSLLHASMGEAMQPPVTQAVRLWRHLTGAAPIAADEQRRIRLDDWELADRVQADVHERWHKAVATGQLAAEDAAWFRAEVHRLYGFAVDGVDYTEPVELDRPWPAPIG
jgi:enoyl-[acyl-carrier protein] reductase/trans-2-enoyl-CoA reductase (NAD+)